MSIQLDKSSILVTGGAGFLGRHVVAELERHGARQIYVPRSADHDLVSGDAVKRLLDQVEPDLVIHLAAVVGGIGANRAHPGRFFYENLMMGAQLIEASRLRNVAKFVAVGTVCSYPKFAPIPFREDDIWDGYPEETNAPYGLAKKMLLVQTQAYREEYDFRGIFLLPVNLYGPGDNADPETSHVIPALIRKFFEARKAGAKHVDVWGTGSASREFLYVSDAARGIVMASERYEGMEPVNLGTGEEITIRELVEKIRAAVGFEGEIRWDASKPDGQPRRCLNVERALEFGFRAETSIDQGLRETIDQYLSEHG